MKYEYDARRRVTKIGLNGTDAYETYTYTEGETEDVAEVKNAKDETFVTVKDKFGNVLCTLYAGAGAAAGTYESHGCVRFTYDAYHNVTKEEDRYTGGTRQYEYTNAAFGTVRKMSVTAERDAEALTEEYGYDGYDKLIQKSLTGAVTQTYAYHYRTDAKQSLEYAELPDNVRAYPQTDKLGRNTGKELTDLAGQRKFGEYVYYRKVGDHATNMPSAVYFGGVQNGKYVIRDNVKYQYDARGNICKIFENGALAVRYEYDSIDRLVREDNKKLGFTVLFAYDNNGNILSKRRTSFTLKTDVEECEFTETLYSYDGDKLLSYGDEACVYADAVGNPTTYRGKTAGWERGRLLNYFGGNSFSYDGQGRRIKKNNTVFTYDGEGNLVKQSDGLEFVYDTNGLSYVKYNNAVYFYRKDAQGNIIALLDNSGNTVVKYRYDAWGNHAVRDANGADIADASHIGNRNPFRYRGYYYDTETELYYLQTRYYDPETGRFITIDGIEYLDPETINGLNLYAYCGNNPVMRVDENGIEWWHWLIGALVVVALVVATCVSAGGAGAGFVALAAAANGVASATVTTTVLSFAAVGAGCMFAASGIMAGIYAVETWSNGGSFLSGLNSAMDYGEEALISTISAGAMGAVGGFMAFKEQIGKSSNAGFMNSSQRRKQRDAFWKAHPELAGLRDAGYQISHIYGTYGNNRNYFILQSPMEHRLFHAIYGYKTNGGPFDRYNPNYMNMWQMILRLFGG